MPEGLLALAFGAGMLAAVNPCGFALLPAYLSLLVVSDTEPGRTRAVGRALTLTAAMTVGFVAVFGVFGLVISPVASSVQQYLPWLTIAIGLLVVVGGLWLLAGRSLPALGWRPRGPELRRSVPAMVGFGASYAIASLTCTIAPFLAIVVTSFRTGSTWNGIQLFTGYALGMGLAVGTAAVAVALANATLVGRMRRLGRWVPKLAGALLLVTGSYVAYYGWWEIRVLDGGADDDPVISSAQDIQGYAAQLVSDLGPAGLTVILVALVLITLGLRALRRRAQHHQAAT
ncbi:MAG: cytochrome c biogenesis CcdA family protein [Actinomycetota bacterium]|nr:cytochrome c biogenesis CcdA family protein [Actinomycetota bacterium]